MSDRRPEISVDDLRMVCEHGYEDAHCDEHPGKGFHFGVVTHEGGCSGASRVSPADLLAVVRRGVESGTIKGEVVRWCRVHEAKASARWDECHVAGRLRGREEDCSIVVDLHIPVSDGGSET